MKAILSLAPQRETALPFELYAGDGGSVGLKFNPVCNAQWKETGEWQQSYYAYPDKGYRFVGWHENGSRVSEGYPKKMRGSTNTARAASWPRCLKGRKAHE